MELNLKVLSIQIGLAEEFFHQIITGSHPSQKIIQILEIETYTMTFNGWLI